MHLYPNLTQPLDFEAANDGVPKPAQVVDSVALTRECVEVGALGLWRCGGHAGAARRTSRASVVQRATSRSAQHYGALAHSSASDPPPPLHSSPLARRQYPLRASKFASVNSLTLFVPAASGGERVRLYYVGLRGEYFGPRAKAPTNIVYESAPQLKDHAKVGTETSQRLG